MLHKASLKPNGKACDCWKGLSVLLFHVGICICKNKHPPDIRVDVCFWLLRAVVIETIFKETLYVVALFIKQVGGYLRRGEIF